MENLLFLQIDSAPGFYYLLVLGKTLDVDVIKSKIKIGPLCTTCGYFKEVIGGIDLFVDENREITHGFYTTNIYWRTYNIFKQNIIIGLETTEELKQQNFKGIHFKKVFGV